MKKLIVILIILMAVFAVCSLEVKDIEVVGNKQYSADEIEQLIIDENTSLRTISILLNDFFSKHKDIPRVDSYKLILTSPTTLKIIVNENPIIGCIFYMSSFMYFDKTGVVAYTKSYSEPGIPTIEGITFKNIVVGQKLEARNKREFSKLSNIAGEIAKTELKPDTITFRGENDITLRLSRIYVSLGDASSIETQIGILAEVYPQLEGKAGTLDLSYAKENMINESYIFKKDSGR